ncbi:MAG: energy-coupling factor transporter transmembrane protein EcfT [Ktedonobacteraceae bacterium]|nr:energy-coupling factor transporter transmembrane protein EcfT [Ktedonobacteraceae bacterium]
MMLKNISPGVYMPGKSLFHRLQARTKLLLLAGFVIWTLIAQRNTWHFLPYAAIALLACLGMALGGISLREIWRRIWLLALLLGIGALFTLSAKDPEGTKILSTLGPLLITYGSARQILITTGLILGALFLISLLPPLRPLMRKRWLRRIRVLVGILLLIALFSLWLIGDAPASKSLPLGPYIITNVGVWTVVSFFVILLVFYSLSLLLTMTTSPVALIEGLTMLLAPLRRLRLPVDDFALMALLALRFIPTLLEELELLLKAQMARGADFTSGTLRERIQNIPMLFIPLIHGALRRASELATALEARGYEVEGRQTKLYETSLGREDYLVMGVVLLIAMVTLLL